MEQGPWWGDGCAVRGVSAAAEVARQGAAAVSVVRYPLEKIEYIRSTEYLRYVRGTSRPKLGAGEGGEGTERTGAVICHIRALKKKGQARG